jgi:ferredoxin
MPHIVTDKCQRCRFTDCVTTCPVACFHGDETMLYIDNVQCVDCTACVQACPVHAIYEISDLPPEKFEWIAINAERAPKLPVIADKQVPLPTAEARKRELGY